MDFSAEFETNVEGIAAEMLSRMPFDDPDACRDICVVLPFMLDVALTSREQRHSRPPASDDLGL